eukprot:m51a1_g13897 hypothetical protein (342) ;mRNA; r:730005-731180
MLATPTRTECIFAALQGPVLRVSSSVVHMYHTYTAELLLPRSWRQSAALSASDVCAALLRLRVASPDTPTEALRCPLCGDVVSVRGPHSEPFGLPEGLESFCVSLRSHCSSPRKHLHAPALVLAIDLAPGLVACSTPFAAFAREPGRHRKRRAAQHPPGAVVLGSDTVEDAEGSSAGGSGSGFGACGSLGELRASDAPAPAWESARVPEDSIEDGRVSRRACDAVGTQHALGEVTVARPCFLSPYVVVEVAKPRNLEKLPPKSIVMIDGLANVLRTLQGFMLQKSCIIDTELAVFVRSFQTKEEAERGVVICTEYYKNNIPNALNFNFWDVCELISRSCNW